MNRWRAEYDDGIWLFYRDGMELGLYEKGDVVIDALNNAESRIAELEAENIRLGIEYQRMRLALGDIAINSKRALNESPTDQLTARWRQERQDDKSPNDTQTQTIVYGKECEG